jgi:hypothetical protein
LLSLILARASRTSDSSQEDAVALDRIITPATANLIHPRQ